MNRLSVPLLALHAIVGMLAVGALIWHLRERETRLDQVRSRAEAERDDSRRMERSITLDEHLRAGLRQRDPFVVELLARERLGWQRTGEYFLPPSAPSAPTARTASIDRPR